MTPEEEADLKQIIVGLVDLLAGKSKHLSLVAALSVAATTAHMIGMPKLEAQRLFVKMYDSRVAEDRQRQTEIQQAPAGGNQ